MRRSVGSAVAAVLLAVLLAGCSDGSGGARGQGGKGTPPDAMPPPLPEPRASGLTELPDGRVQALGRLARIELEGGFWAIVGPSGEQGGTSSVVAVIANADEWEDALARLEGSVVVAVGRRFEGMTIRMAGPEIVVEELREAGTVPGKPK